MSNVLNQRRADFLRLVAQPTPDDEQAGRLEWLEQHFLCPLGRRVVLALRGGLLCAKQISRRLSGGRPSSKLRELLAILVDRGVLDVGRDGYAVTDDYAFEAALRQGGEHE
jgi:hypothetical protein